MNLDKVENPQHCSRLHRQILGSLRKAERVWKDVFNLISDGDAEKDDSIGKIEKLRADVVHDLQFSPNCNRLKHYAEIFNLTPKEMRRVVEVFNPDRFSDAQNKKAP